MRTIRDYVLAPTHGAIGFQIPTKSEFLHAGNEGTTTRLWLLVDSEEPVETVEFFIAFRDQPVPAWCVRATYRAAVLMRTAFGELQMAHVFERPRDETHVTPT